MSTLCLICISIYIFLMYNAQESLIPTTIHSVSIYLLIGFTIVNMTVKSKMIFSGFSRWYFIFFCIIVLSAMIYIESDSTIIYSCFVAMIVSFCIMQDITTKGQIVLIANIYVISAITMSILIYSTGQLNFLIYSNIISEQRLGTELTGNANIFSALFMYAGVFAAWLAIYLKKRSNKFIFLLFLIAILFMMAISGGRKTIVAVIICLSVFTLLSGTQGKKSRYIKNIIKICIAIGLLIYSIMTIPILYEYIGERFEGLFEMLGGGSAVVAGDEIRERMIDLAWNGWLEKPLFGHGIDSFKFYNQHVTGHFYYAHNNYLELLYDVGLIGLMIYYSIFIIIYNRLSKLSSNDYKFKILGYGLLTELLIFDFGGVSYYMSGNIILLAIAYLCSCKTKSISDGKNYDKTNLLITT